MFTFYLIGLFVFWVIGLGLWNHLYPKESKERES